MPITKTNQPKVVFNLSPSIFLAKNPPINTPAVAIDVIRTKNSQLILKWPISPVNPTRELSAMISNEVPIATFMGILINRTKAGINKKPPPAPSKPVAKPIATPYKISLYNCNGSPELGWPEE